MKIGIIGGGSIGLLIGGNLSKNHSVTIYVRRTEQQQQLNEYGLHTSQFLNPVPIKALTIEDLRQEDLLIVCVKQPQLVDVITEINKSNQDTAVIFLQNGMGHLEHIKNFSQTVILGVVEHGAFRKNDYSVIHTGDGTIKLARYHGEMNEFMDIVQALDTPAFSFQVADDWNAMLRDKLVINAVINPLTAIFNVKNGEIVNNPHLVELAKGLCHEAALILGLDYVQHWRQVEMVAMNTKDNISSMLKDIRQQQETEVEAISGYLVKNSTQQIPFTTFVYHSIKALEGKKGIRK